MGMLSRQAPARHPAAWLASTSPPRALMHHSIRPRSPAAWTHPDKIGTEGRGDKAKAAGKFHRACRRQPPTQVGAIQSARHDAAVAAACHSTASMGTQGEAGDVHTGRSKPVDVVPAGRQAGACMWLPHMHATVGLRPTTTVEAPLTCASQCLFSIGPGASAGVLEPGHVTCHRGPQRGVGACVSVNVAWLSEGWVHAGRAAGLLEHGRAGRSTERRIEEFVCVDPPSAVQVLLGNEIVCAWPGAASLMPMQGLPAAWPNAGLDSAGGEDTKNCEAAGNGGWLYQRLQRRRAGQWWRGRRFEDGCGGHTEGQGCTMRLHAQPARNVQEGGHTWLGSTSSMLLPLHGPAPAHPFHVLKARRQAVGARRRRPRRSLLLAVGGRAIGGVLRPRGQRHQAGSQSG